MVSFARKGEEENENPLAKLLQATQDVIDKDSNKDTSVTAEGSVISGNRMLEDTDQQSEEKSKKHSVASLSTNTSGINAMQSPYPPPPVAFMSGPLVAQAAMLSAHPLYGPEPEEESCGRPFCKLK